MLRRKESSRLSQTSVNQIPFPTVTIPSPFPMLRPRTFTSFTSYPQQNGPPEMRAIFFSVAPFHVLYNGLPSWLAVPPHLSAILRGAFVHRTNCFPLLLPLLSLSPFALRLFAHFLHPVLPRYLHRNRPIWLNILLL
jgi:hypothetical protein